MRCLSCGGQLHHLVTTVDDRQLLQCKTGLTTMLNPDYQRHPKRVVTGIIQCGLVYDDRGNKADGKFVYYAYYGEKKIPEALTVQNGIIKTK